MMILFNRGDSEAERGVTHDFSAQNNLHQIYAMVPCGARDPDPCRVRNSGARLCPARHIGICNLAQPTQGRIDH